VNTLNPISAKRIIISNARIKRDDVLDEDEDESTTSSYEGIDAYAGVKSGGAFMT
jgi:hypothetical protein